MDKSAIMARRLYMQKYRGEHRSQINKKQKEWRKKNPEKVREIIERYWERRAINNE